MLNEENTKLCWNLLAKYGVTNQYYKIIEECAELQEAASHILQGGGNKENFLEEMVDVIVLCQQHLNNEHVADDEVNARARAKILRALRGDHEKKQKGE